MSSRKIAIVGGAPNMAHLLPAEWELWRLGRFVESACRVDRIFELHEPNVYSEYARHIEARKVPVYMKVPALAGAVDARVGELHARWGYITNSIAFMLATAIAEGVSDIELHGCPMGDGGIYAHQKPSAMYYIGIAVGSGITVVDRSGMVDWGACYG